MSSLFLMITITDRRSTDGFLQLYKSHGVTVSMRTVGSGTAVQETLSTLGLEKTEKAVLLAVVTAESWQKIQKDLRRKMQIDVPGTGMEGAAAFLGVELVNEKELVLIVSRTSQKNTIMKAIMEGANPKAGAIVFSLPVTDTAGLRLMEEDEAQPEAAL